MNNRKVSMIQIPATAEESGDRRRSSTMTSDLAKRRQSQAPGFALNAKRKQSIWRGSISETSNTTPQNQAKIAMENTYRLDPLDKERFNPCEVARVIKAVLRRFLQDVKYSATESPSLCKEISQQLTHEIKELGYPRHKFVCHVVIGEKQDQGFNIVSRCLWNPTTDSYASAEFDNQSLFAVATAHGIYFE